ncbi:response regulator transcription factor [Solicola gregarius]|uniref:Sensory transduction protein RegX3 n=1 Tax=Solicola gregarius TaxID=2908642 RepID=A0AA46TEZ6_9ACTN|nr:response regulator transcription factor [Solicola gregarius]UYM03963.1 response regulator transcription factor [Solicola gregarius]
MHILLVEDDDRVVAALRPALHRANLRVDRAATAAEALGRLEGIDLILLDMGLPDQDGLALCRQIRMTSEVPIIAVTARREESMVVAALRSGVDDYVTKPYRLAELVARIDAVMRRFDKHPAADVDEFGRIRIDAGARRAYVDEQPISLARKEFDLLHLLVRSNGDLVTREAIMETIWATSWVGASRTIDVHVATLRAKLGEPTLIETVRGAGYRLAGVLDA